MFPLIFENLKAFLCVDIIISKMGIGTSVELIKIVFIALRDTHFQLLLRQVLKFYSKLKISANKA